MAKKTVIITGASRGLGAAAAKIMTDMGANLVLVSRSADVLKELVQEINPSGSRVITVVGDISRAEVCTAVVTEALAQHGQIDAVVNNAGVIAPIAAIANSDIIAWQRNVAINLFGPFMLTQAALPHLRHTNGRVINVSSGAAVNPIPGWAAYCTAKAALNQFTAVLAREEEAITTVALRPGVVNTDMQVQIRRDGATGMPPYYYERFVRYHEEGALNPPELPGRALAVLALHAPHEWSGAFISWEDERVQALVRQHNAA